MLITILVLCLTCWFAGAAPCLRAGGWVAFRLIHHRFESATLLQGLQRGPGIERNQSQGHAAESTVWCSLSSVEWHPTSHRGDTGGRHFRHQLSRRNAIRAAGSAILCPSARGCSCLGMAAFPKASMPRPDPRPRKRPSQGRRDAPPNALPRSIAESDAPQAECNAERLPKLPHRSAAKNQACSSLHAWQSAQP